MGYRYSRKRKRGYDTGAAGAIMTLFFLLPFIFHKPKRKTKNKKVKTLQETIDEHFE